MTEPEEYRVDSPVRVSIDYADTPGNVSRRRITVHCISWSEDEITLQAWCSVSRARRTFLTHRITEVIDDRGLPLTASAFARMLRDAIGRGDFAAHARIRDRQAHQANLATKQHDGKTVG